MARNAENDQIFLCIVAEATPRLKVMDLEIFRSPADLATPAVPLQDLPAELTISLRLKLQAWPFRSNRRQGAT